MFKLQSLTSNSCSYVGMTLLMAWSSYNRWHQRVVLTWAWHCLWHDQVTIADIKQLFWRGHDTADGMIKLQSLTSNSCSDVGMTLLMAVLARSWDLQAKLTSDIMMACHRISWCVLEDTVFASRHDQVCVLHSAKLFCCCCCCFSRVSMVVCSTKLTAKEDFGKVQQFSSLADWVIGGNMRDDPAEILSQSFLQEAIVSSSGMGRGVHSLTFSIQHFFSWPQRHPSSKVRWRMVLERVSWCVTCPYDESFHLLTVARRGSCGPARKLILPCTQSLVWCCK